MELEVPSTRYFKRHSKEMAQTSARFYTAVPPVRDATQSFLYLPLIFFRIPELSVEFPATFETLFRDTLVEANLTIVEDLQMEALPFTPLTEFGAHLDAVLRTKNLTTLALLEHTYDQPNHISGLSQEDILYDNDARKEYFFSTLVDRVIASMPSETFQISKRAHGGRRTRRARRGKSSRTRRTNGRNHRNNKTRQHR